jgi:hypothetical protein
MQESDFVIVEEDAKLLPTEARILRRMADLIKQRGLDSLFAFLQPTLVPHTEPIVTRTYDCTIVPAAPTATVGILRKLVVEWLKKCKIKLIVK